MLTLNQAFLLLFSIFHLFLLLPLFLFKPSYSDVVLAYLASYPFFYLVYVVANAVKEGGGTEGALEATPKGVASATVSFTYFVWLNWMFLALRTTNWWKDWLAWTAYLGLNSLLFLLLYLFRLTKGLAVDCGRAIDALAPLSVFHYLYFLAAMFSAFFVEPTPYRLLLWYFAIYPTALAAAVAGGGRRTTLTVTAIYLAAYTLNTEPLLLLLAAIPAIRRLSSPKPSQRT